MAGIQSFFPPDAERVMFTRRLEGRLSAKAENTGAGAAAATGGCGIVPPGEGVYFSRIFAG